MGLQLQVEESLRSVQEECVRLTAVAEEAREEAREEAAERERAMAEARAGCREEVAAALEKERLAAEREEKAVRSMEEMTQSLQVSLAAPPLFPLFIIRRARLIVQEGGERERWITGN